MKYFNLLLLFVVASNTFAQIHKKTIATKQPQKTVEYALIKGHIKNNPTDLLDYGTDDFLSYNLASIPIDKQGNFSRKIRIDGVVREVMIRAGSGISLKLRPNDTVTLEWDNHNTNGTLSIIANKAIRTSEFQKAFKVRVVSMQNHQAISNLYSSKIADSVKFRAINDKFNQEIEMLLADDPYHLASTMAVDTYFEYLRLLQLWNLFPHYELYLKTEDAKNRIPWMVGAIWSKPYKTESYDNFMTSGAYRDFIFDYPRTLTFSYRPDRADGKKLEEAGLSFAMSEYYKGLGSFNLIELRDWYITKSIFSDFEYYDFDDAVKVYQDFLPKVKIPFYADTLKTFYENIKRLKPGVPAPLFKLKDETGKLVSLNDFKGKVVYIDFWGIGCGPCVAAIKEQVPGLHEQYKDKEVVFINICVDSDEKTWKESIKNLKLGGVNLLAQGWTSNPVCNIYNVTGIPHYYLINKTGAIVNNNSKPPGLGVETDIDKLLK